MHPVLNCTRWRARKAAGGWCSCLAVILKHVHRVALPGKAKDLHLFATRTHLRQRRRHLCQCGGVQAVGGAAAVGAQDDGQLAGGEAGRLRGARGEPGGAWHCRSELPSHAKAVPR